ncbi:hypothetical protein Pcinc_012121 [Petrolisthes cinctipes]|uniref:Uncharacterized protein n=1 Tax=Petrolisthes cinctipes TaxID=88211 RepID=A0AAE1G5H4_PETCI|nr:hypothetical protein Pcinc_012121 [Petrolisthes cinctipes]
MNLNSNGPLKSQKKLSSGIVLTVSFDESLFYFSSILWDIRYSTCNMTTIKKYKTLPVHIVEDHNDALYHILRAVGSKHLPFSGNLLIHFDSHPDLLIPTDLKASEVFDVPEMLEKLSIENWILVAVYAGQISTIVWIKPEWSNQIEDGSYKFLIGKQKGTDNIRLSSSVLYFVGEMLYCKESELENTKEVNLRVVTLKESLAMTLSQDLQQFIEEHSGFYILDVDLDFFSTMNPFVSMYKQVNMYSRLQQIYCFDYTDTDDEESLRTQVQKRYHQITALKDIFNTVQELQDPEVIGRKVASVCETIGDRKEGGESIMQQGKEKRENKEEKIMAQQETREIITYLEKEVRENLAELIQDLSRVYGEKVDWGLVHDAGCTWDDERHQLPHHVSTQEEMDSLIEKFGHLVTGLPVPPTLVTVARSSLDDYCPPHQVDGLQEAVCQILHRAYSIECKKHYEEENN